MGLKEKGLLDGVDWIHLAQAGDDRQLALVITVMNALKPKFRLFRNTTVKEKLRHGHGELCNTEQQKCRKVLEGHNSHINGGLFRCYEELMNIFFTACFDLYSKLFSDENADQHLFLIYACPDRTICKL